jgi:hypothetical protein
MAATMRSMLRAMLLFLTSSEAKFILPAWQLIGDWSAVL